MADTTLQTSTGITIRPGYYIRYETFMGGTRAGIVTATHEDIKNGWPGFDMRTIDGDDCWGYAEQAIYCAPKYIADPRA